MKKIDKLLILNTAKIKKCFQQLNLNQEKILICVNKKKEFQGVITDGDLRRALLKGASLNEKIEKYIKKNALSVNRNISKEKALSMLSSKKILIPVLDSFNKVIDFYSLKDTIKTSDNLHKDVTVIGLGYVGLTLSCILADAGFNVTGYDYDKKLISELKKKKSNIFEIGLQSYLDANVGRNLTFSNKLIKNSASIFIVCVGTFVNDKSKIPNLSHVKQASRNLGKIISKDNLVLFRSTLPIGCTRKVLIPILEKYSKLKVSKEFNVAYAPERTAEGVALKELKENPQIIGGYDENSTTKALSFFNKISPTVIKVSSLEAAELCKLIDNSYRDHIFAFINQFTKLAEKLNIDLSKVVDSVNQGYERNNIPKPSPSVGGTCLYKDPHILASSFNEYKLDKSLILKSRNVNELGHIQVFKKLKKLLNLANKNIYNSKIFLIGMAFKGKPETSDLRNSTSLWFLSQFKNKKNIFAFDYNVSKKEIEKLGIKFLDLKKGFHKADAAIILNNNPKYNEMNIFKMLNLMNKPSVFIDTWHIFEPAEIKKIKGIIYGGHGND
tara:strand:+ start:8550 stop:10214 length:1665 start_codon:yes stop_codon:yes gene_type:complete